MSPAVEGQAATHRAARLATRFEEPDGPDELFHRRSIIHAHLEGSRRVIIAWSGSGTLNHMSADRGGPRDASQWRASGEGEGTAMNSSDAEVRVLHKQQSAEQAAELVCSGMVV